MARKKAKKVEKIVSVEKRVGDYLLRYNSDVPEEEIVSAVKIVEALALDPAADGMLADTFEIELSPPVELDESDASEGTGDTSPEPGTGKEADPPPSKPKKMKTIDDAWKTTVREARKDAETVHPETPLGSLFKHQVNKLFALWQHRGEAK